MVSRDDAQTGGALHLSVVVTRWADSPECRVQFPEMLSPSPRQLDSTATILGIGRNTFSVTSDAGSTPVWVLKEN